MVGFLSPPRNPGLAPCRSGHDSQVQELWLLPHCESPPRGSALVAGALASFKHTCWSPLPRLRRGCQKLSRSPAGLGPKSCQNRPVRSRLFGVQKSQLSSQGWLTRQVLPSVWRRAREQGESRSHFVTRTGRALTRIPSAVLSAKFQQFNVVSERGEQLCYVLFWGRSFEALLL